MSRGRFITLEGIEGAGIGLSVTQALLTMMAGRIAVSSREGEGSTFAIALPSAP